MLLVPVPSLPLLPYSPLSRTRKSYATSDILVLVAFATTHFPIEALVATLIHI
jgi:hypothetical protein